MRRFKPCLLNSLSWNLEVDDENEMQACLTGVAICFEDGGENTKPTSEEAVKEDKDLVFSLEDTSSETSTLEHNNLVKAKALLPTKYFLSAYPK